MWSGLDRLAAGTVEWSEQDDSRAVYAHKIKKQEAEIDWNMGAQQIERTIRAFNPAPVAFTSLNNVKIRVWEAVTLNAGAQAGNPGEIVGYSPEGLDVSTGNRTLRILTLQLEGKKKQGIREICNGYPDLFASSE